MSIREDTPKHDSDRLNAAAYHDAARPDSISREQAGVLEIADDPSLQAAIGRVSLREAHLDELLRLTYRTLGSLTSSKAREDTARMTSGKLRRKITKLAEDLLAEDDAALSKLEDLLRRCKRVTSRRTLIMHETVAHRVSGEFAARS